MIEFLKAHIQLLDRAIEENNGIDEAKLKPCLDALANLAAALEEGATNKVVMFAYSLGRAFERLDKPDDETAIKAMSALIEKMEREQPLMRVNALRETVKEHAQSIARDLWANDAEEEYRLSEVCGLVRAELTRLGYDLSERKSDLHIEIPKDLRPWLRPAAPDYAKKGGRPKK